jgi:EAL domain-containing protein (putative c-di-GMP-specific phosphodiesterase class I)
LQELHALGVKLSIDDFGTGYSSLAYLKRMPVQELKIDRGFVMNMLHSKEDATIVKATIDLGHNLALQVVAEGVENEAIAVELCALGCDFAQGYHYAKPMPISELKHFVSTFNHRQKSDQARDNVNQN